MSRLTTKTAFQYFKHESHEWIVTPWGDTLPRDLTEKVLKEGRPYLKPGDKFTVRAKGALDGIAKGTTTVEFAKVVDAPLAIPLPQTLLEYKNWLEAINDPDAQLLAAEVMHAQVFEFGEVDERLMDKDTKRAIEFRDKGFLKLPYRCVVYRYTGALHGRRHVVALQDGPVFMRGDNTDTKHYVLELSLRLTARNVKLITEQPSHKLQEKRKERGKPPLPYITRVDSEHYEYAVRNTHAGGTHASPVPHLRRGHLRHLQNGHTIWIRDMLINCRSVEEAFPRRGYEVHTT